MDATRPGEFLRYREASPAKRLEFENVLSYLSVDLSGKAFLDIGPGYGDALDIAHQRGASRVEFVEMEPFFFTFNRLKGWCRGIQADHLTHLHQFEEGRFDLIWVKGSLNADMFNGPTDSSLGSSRLRTWLVDAQRLLRPGGTLVLCPFWINHDGARSIADVEGSTFTRVVLATGFKALPRVPEHNHEPEYPITFIARIPG